MPDTASVAPPAPKTVTSSFAGSNLTIFGAETSADDGGADCKTVEEKAMSPRRPSRFGAVLSRMPTRVALLLTGVAVTSAAGPSAWAASAWRRYSGSARSRPGNHGPAGASAYCVCRGGEPHVLPGVLYYRKGYIDCASAAGRSADCVLGVADLLAACGWAIDRVSRLAPRFRLACARAIMAGRAR